MPAHISIEDLKGLREDGITFALIDVREHGEYRVAHIPSSDPVPRRLLEFRMSALVPFKGTRIVLYDDDGRRARLAGATLERMGFNDVAVLDGGINQWATAGLPIEQGTYTSGRDFGAKVLVRDEVPEIGSQELQEKIRRGEEVIILDTRTPEEH